MKGGMWRMHAFSHKSYHIISPTGIHSTDTQQHRDATHTYTRTYIHAHRCMYMSRYVAYLLHPFIVFFIHIYDSLQGAGNVETPARVYKICEYIPSLLRSLIYMTLYRELGTVRPQQESIKFINTSHHHANVLTLCSLLYFSHMHTFAFWR